MWQGDVRLALQELEALRDSSARLHEEHQRLKEENLRLKGPFTSAGSNEGGLPHGDPM